MFFGKEFVVRRALFYFTPSLHLSHLLHVPPTFIPFPTSLSLYPSVSLPQPLYQFYFSTTSPSFASSPRSSLFSRHVSAVCFSNSLTLSLPHSLIHSLTLSFSHSLSHSLIPSLPHSLTLSLFHSLIHSLTLSLSHSLLSSSYSAAKHPET